MPLSGDAAVINFDSFGAVVTPAATDEFVVRQIDGVQRIETRAQVHTLEAGEHFILPQVDEPLTPTFAFGDGDTGFFERTPNVIDISIGGSETWEIDSSFLGTSNITRAAIRNSTASATLPVLVPSQSDSDTGIGLRTTDIGVLVAGAQNCIEFGEAAGAPLIGFYGTAAIAKQLGVAVTAAGIHAALVALGLIT